MVHQNVVIIPHHYGVWPPRGSQLKSLSSILMSMSVTMSVTVRWDLFVKVSPKVVPVQCLLHTSKILTLLQG
jgi:hypothetical protein